MSPAALPQAAFWHGRRVLLTGHTGFKGSWLALWLARLGAQVTGLALAPHTTPSLFHSAGIDGLLESHLVDVRDAQATARVVRAARPEIVLHLAAQPLVRASYLDPLGTYHTNVMGTAHVLDALRGLDSVRVAVMVTTDKVYQPQASTYPYRETDALGGHDPYSASKAASELLIASYRSAFLAEQGVAVASARAGNVIGGGDWSDDRLIPDAVRAWAQGGVLDVRRPEAIRPWQHVLEPLAGYLRLAEWLWDGKTQAPAFNFGPLPHEAATVRTVIDLARAAYGQGEVQYGDGSAGPHEAGWLALETSAARQSLGVAPVWDLATAVTRTLHWYRAFGAPDASARALCDTDLDAYQASALPHAR